MKFKEARLYLLENPGTIAVSKNRPHMGLTFRDGSIIFVDSDSGKRLPAYDTICVVGHDFDVKVGVVG